MMDPNRKTVKKTTRLNDSNLAARGEPALWTMGGTLVLGVLMIIALLVLVVWNGMITFYPGRLQVVTLTDGRKTAGEPHRFESYRLPAARLAALDENQRKTIAADNGFAKRVLYKIGNFDFYNEDFRWVDEFAIRERVEPKDMVYIERLEWGPFIGRIRQAEFDGKVFSPESGLMDHIGEEHVKAVLRREEIERIERKEISDINHHLEAARLELKRVGLEEGFDSDVYVKAAQKFAEKTEQLNHQYRQLEQKAEAIKQENERFRLTLQEIGGQEKTIRLSDVVRLYDANNLNLIQKLGIYLDRWIEFLTDEPREANMEGGVMPAIFGTFCMTILLVFAVAPFGVMAALYLREYARQGHLVSIVRISVNNLAGVPSIVYGVFGLGFFAYTLGGRIDALFYPEKLPNPTFGTGGLLWASLTLALLTVPVVIVATEEALAAVPKSLREGSLACGASKWQTIRNIVLPKAFPGVLTGLILAMARGAGEVAPFQSRNAEAGKPMVFVTTLLLIVLVAVMNAAAIHIRNRLNRRFSAGHF